MPPASSFRRLDEEKILATVRRLEARIWERFPEGGLGHVGTELSVLAASAGRKADVFARRNVVRRAVALVLSGILLVVVVILGIGTVRDDGVTDLASYLQTLEAGLGSIVFLGAAIFFVMNYDNKRSRDRLLEALDELRSIAHVVDMHQLSKSPEKLLFKEGVPTKSSPVEDMGAYELSRYLDYCSEMLALISKIAALYVRDVTDPAMLIAADEIESLTGGLSRKIWQKIMILTEGRRAPAHA